MMKSKKGFTLIELMIVIAIIAIIAAIAIPNLLESKKISNERTAPATLKSVHSAQEIFKQKAFVDADADGTGEYGVLEGSGVANGDLVAASMINMQGNGAGVCEKGGYLLMGYLPAATDDAEEGFMVGAGPKKWDKTGNKAFFINESGSTYEAANAAGAVADGAGNLVTTADVYATVFDNTTIIAATWTVMK